MYKPPNITFRFYKLKNLVVQNARIILEDFNCHSMSWGCKETSNDGHVLEGWVVSEKLSFIHDHKLQALSNIGRWKRGYNLKLTFVNEAVSRKRCFKKIIKLIPSTQYRPILCEITAAISQNIVPFRRRFNFKKYCSYIFDMVLY